MKVEVSKTQICKAADMLRFLFSFCGARGDAVEVEPKDQELEGAFEVVRKLADESGSPLRGKLRMA